MNKIYLLFSDGTWASTTNKEHINNIIEEHHFPFPLDIKGDSRRSVTLIENYHSKTEKTHI